jgi:DNA-binding LacI/PurR family transcriptional regulator
VRRQRRLAHLCQQAGITSEALTFQTPKDAHGFSSYHDMPDAVRKAVLAHLNASPRKFTGIVCYNDNVGAGVMDALADAGLRVPQDVSVIGHDNFEGRRCRPKLTSVDHRLAEMGRKAAELLLSMVGDRARVEELRGHRELIDPLLVVRDSTGPARG